MTVAAGAAGVASGFGAAGFLAMTGSLALGLAAGLSAAGVSVEGGASETCADAAAVRIRQAARIIIGRRTLMPAPIPARPSLCRTRRRAPVGSPVRHPPVPRLRRADRPR